MNTGFTLPELLAAVVLISLLAAAQILLFGDRQKLAKLESAVLYAQTWANEAGRVRQSGELINGNVHTSRLAQSQVAPLRTPFGTPYHITSSAIGTWASFIAPFAFTHPFADTTPLSNGRTRVTVSAVPLKPSLAMVEKLQLYQQVPVL